MMNYILFNPQLWINSQYANDVEDVDYEEVYSNVNVDDNDTYHD